MWTLGDVSLSQTLTDNDHLYPSHINELRTAISANVTVDINGHGDYTDIQTALDAISAVGGVVHVKPGTYNTAVPIKVPSNVTLEGEGVTTIINALQFTVADEGVIENADQTDGNDNVVIRDLLVEVNGTVNSQPDYTHGIYIIKGTGSSVRNVKVQNGTTTGSCGIVFGFVTHFNAYGNEITGFVAGVVDTNSLPTTSFAQIHWKADAEL